jgi:hypothetical protein
MPLSGRRAIYRNPFCSHRVFDQNSFRKSRRGCWQEYLVFSFLPFAISNFFSSHTREISLAPFWVWAEAGQGPHYFRKAEKQPRQPHPNLRDQHLPPFWPQRWQHRLLCSQGRLLIQSLCLPIQNYRSNSALAYDTFLQIPLSPPSQENYVPTGARMPSG